MFFEFSWFFTIGKYKMYILLIHYINDSGIEAIQYYGPFQTSGEIEGYFFKNRTKIAHSLGLKEHQIEYDWSGIVKIPVFLKNDTFPS